MRVPDVVGLPLDEARARLARAGFSVHVERTAAPEEPARRRRRQVGGRPLVTRVVRARPGPGAGEVRLLVADFPLPPVPPEVLVAAGFGGEDAAHGAE